MTFFCTHCGQRIDAPDSAHRQRVPCPACGSLSVPPPESAAGRGTRRALITGSALALLALLLWLFIQSHHGLGTELLAGVFGPQLTGRETGEARSGDQAGRNGPPATDTASRGESDRGSDAPSETQAGPSTMAIPPTNSPSTNTPKVGAIQTPPREPPQAPPIDTTNSKPTSLLVHDSGVPSTSTGATAAAPGFFGARGKGTKFVYVVDRSTSMMARGRFDAARAELIKSLRSLQPGMSFYVIFYDTRYEAMNVNTLQPASRVQDYIPWIERQRPQGGTDPREAMEIALKLSPHSIWLLSDGEFSDSVLEEIRLNNPARKTAINTIALHDGSGERLLQKIAQENNGEYRFVPPPTVANSPPRPANLRPPRGFPQRQP